MAKDPLLRDAVRAIKAKIETAAEIATPEELAYLGTAIDRIGGRATVLEVEEMGDIKMAEMSAHANAVEAATLDTIAEHGIHAVTHRKIATCAGVPLGSMTYYFDGMEPLLEEAFTWFTRQMSQQYRDFFAGVTGPEMACESITTLIHSSQVTTPHNMALMYQLYAFMHRSAALKTVMQDWMKMSQTTLEQWFDPVTTRALDAFIEGMTLHYVTDRAPLSREEIRAMVGRIAGITPLNKEN